MEKSWNSICWEISWKSHGNSNSGKENIYGFAFQYLYYHINHDIIKISFGTNMHCSLAEICAMTTFDMLFILFSHAKFSVNFALFS